MPPENTIYDLLLLLSTSGEDDERTKILAEVESAITSGGGSIERNDDWGVRPLAFRINHQSDADYHLLQFSGPPALLDSLSHSLRINDGVLRFRIIKVIPGTPPAPDSPPPVIATAAQSAAAQSAAAQSGVAHGAAPPSRESEPEAEA